MAKSSKKKNRKLRRQIRKTLGALFMVSAITVAAIPVPDVSAVESEVMPLAEDTGKGKIQVLNYTSTAMTEYDDLGEINTTGADLSSISSFFRSTVPFVDPKSVIYTTGDGMFQFAFVKPSATAADEVAVILGANVTNLPAGGSLTIPSTVDAYKKYTANSTSSGYCAVSRNGEYLYYPKEVHKEITYEGTNTKYPAYLIVGLPEGHKYSGKEVTTIGLGSALKSVKNEDDTWSYYYVEKAEAQDDDGNDIVNEYQMIPVMEDSYAPCYYDKYSEWSGRADDELYYQPEKDSGVQTDSKGFAKAEDKAHQRIYNAEVQYIGRQYLVANTKEDGTLIENQSEWKIAEKNNGLVTASNPEDGVFAGKGQIVNLTIGDNLLGIGDYAFYGCTGLNSVSLGNGLSTIGNSAFAGCINLVSCNMQLNSAIGAIGAKAFQDCRGLTNIVIPVNVRAIGDYCFDGCTRLQTIDLCGQGQNVSLQAIGYKAFNNCSSLTKLEFPDTYKDFEKVTAEDGFGTDTNITGIPISYLDGCTSLQFIIVRNAEFTFLETEHKDNLSCAIGSFLKQMPASFYFEGPEGAAIHTTSRRHSAAFKYLDQEIYERVLWCPETEYDKEGNLVYDETTGKPKGHEAIFAVDSSNRLVNMVIDKECGIVEIPANIGSHGVETIGSNSFQNNCLLQKIIIPSTVKFIESNAFKGCHNLKHVIFSKPVNIESIGAGAFNTQDVASHKTECPNKTIGNAAPELSFTGEISPDSVPFQYAMDSGNNFNASTQPRTYITFYSGWPTNLTVQYNNGTGKNELIDYPRYDELANYVAWTKDSPAVDPKKTYPDLTEEYATAAQNAVGKYEKGETLTQDERNIINSALNINLPAGIESIKHGIFSDIILKQQKDYEGEDYTGPVLITKENEDEYKDKAKVNSKPYNYVNSKIESITMNTVEELEPYTFAGCTGLKGFYMSGGDSIGDYVFYDCNSLTNAEVASSVTELGTRPFAGCTKLPDVNFIESPYFISENGVIFGLSDGAKTSIIECLEPGEYVVGPTGLEGITSIAKEAFMGCSELGKVDLSSTSVEEIPEGCFRDTSSLREVYLPDTIGTIEKASFWNSGLRLIRIPGNPSIIATNAFRNWEKFDTPTAQEREYITFQCIEGGTADRYAKSQQNSYINPAYGDVFMEYTVRFLDYPNYPDTDETVPFFQTKAKSGENAELPVEKPEPKGDAVFIRWNNNYMNIVKDTEVYPIYGKAEFDVTFRCGRCGQQLGEVQRVGVYESAEEPEKHEHEGFTFREWSTAFNRITADTDVMALYDDNSGSTSRHIATFYDEDGNVIAEVPVEHGGTVYNVPPGPPKEGYTFVSWMPSNFTNITGPMQYWPKYEKSASSSSSGGSGSGSGGSGSNASASPSASPTAEPEATPGVTKYTVSVSGGSGSGQYAAGEIVAVNAYFMGSGQNFEKWTTSTAGVGFANPNASSTTFTMPAANVAITATYATGSGTPIATSTGGGSSSGGSSSGGGSGNKNSNGTSVQVTRPGISNEGLAGATVSGSTDNFVVKVTEDQSAANAVVAALQARYGDISRIRYLPMDINLYDSTGRTKIADTSGISVNLTLPIPDDLVQYAGNNKVAAIVNGSMEDLNVRFTTVGGVPCVNFTATHFSPYVIYVDTANLTASTIDATPKTGDPIHPKWFLAIGMACISLILFFKRDKVVVKAA